MDNEFTKKDDINQLKATLDELRTTLANMENERKGNKSFLSCCINTEIRVIHFEFLTYNSKQDKKSKIWFKT